MKHYEFLEAIVNGTEITDELRTYAAAELEKDADRREKRNAYAATKRAEKNAEREPIRAALLAVITDEPKTATTLIAEAGVDVTPQAVPSLLKPAYVAGTIDKVAIKVPGKGSHVGYVKA